MITKGTVFQQDGLYQSHFGAKQESAVLLMTHFCFYLSLSSLLSRLSTICPGSTEALKCCYNQFVLDKSEAKRFRLQFKWWLLTPYLPLSHTFPASLSTPLSSFLYLVSPIISSLVSCSYTWLVRNSVFSEYMLSNPKANRWFRTMDTLMCFSSFSSKANVHNSKVRKP